MMADSPIVAAALLAACRLFVSEDLQDGRSIDGMRIANPFAPAFAAMLERG